jgi:hypothetical protein
MDAQSDATAPCVPPGLLARLSRRIPLARGLAGTVKVANAAEKAGLPSVAAITLPNQIGWIFNSIAADGNRIGSAFAGSSPTTRDISVVTGSINAVPTLCDIGLSAAETVYTVSRIATGMKVVNQGGSDALLASDAQRMLTQHKADLIRSMPGTLRDVVLGSVSLPARVFGDVHPGESLFGGLTAAYHATSSVTMSSGALFVAAGALSARAIDRSVDRNLALSGALRNPPSRRTDTFGSEASALDDKLANDPDALISPNVHSILRTHDDDYIAAFMNRFESLDPDRRKQLKRLLHFPGEQIKLNALNLGRCTNLNTASHRREVREKVIDAFVAYDLQGDSAESLFSHLEKIKKEARGGRERPAAGSRAEISEGPPDRSSRVRMEHAERLVHLWRGKGFSRTIRPAGQGAARSPSVSDAFRFLALLETQRHADDHQGATRRHPAGDDQAFCRRKQYRGYRIIQMEK